MRLLQELTGGRDNGQRWVRILAFQELARYHLNGGRTTQARALIDEGLTLFPDNERMKILLLSLSDQTSTTPRDTAALLMNTPRGRSPLTPRARYNQWPGELTTAIRQLDEEVAGRLPLLQRALFSGVSP